MRRVHCRSQVTALSEPQLARDVAPAVAPPPAAGVRKASSYRQILSSSAWIGGSQVLNILIGIVRTKVLAVLLGPAGFGLMGMLTAVADLARSVCSMGLNSSGVRQIAEAAASQDQQRVARTATVLRRTALLLGVAGALLLLVTAQPLARLTFGDDGLTGAVAVLSLAVLLRLIADAEGALLQGLRQVASVAKVAVWSTVLGTAASIPLVYWWREQGVAMALVAIAAASAGASWWYTRKLAVSHAGLSSSQARQEAAALLKLGVAFMVSGLLLMGTAYLVRLILVQADGLHSAGLYQAAWTLGGLYVGIVLQAMGTDFYPRLVGAITDFAECNRLVNEQAHVSVLLAGAGVLATIALSPLLVWIFYSAQFSPAAETLRWICLGMAVRIVSFPVGYVIIARGNQRVFIATELAWTLVNIGLSWLFIEWYGLRGAGIAFFVSYVFHAAMVYPIVRRQTGFAWSAANRRAIPAFALTTAAAFCAFYVLPLAWAIGLGCLLAVAASVGAWRSLRSLVAADGLPRGLRGLFAREAGAAPAAEGSQR
jgi:PST family polysaccharide transporter